MRDVDLTADRRDHSKQNGLIMNSLPLPPRPLPISAEPRHQRSTQSSVSESVLSALPMTQTKATTEAFDVLGTGTSADQRATRSAGGQLPEAPATPEFAETVAGEHKPNTTPQIYQLGKTISPADPIESTTAPTSDAIESPSSTPMPLLESVMDRPPRTLEHRVRWGDTLAEIFSNAGLSPNLLHRVVNSSDTAARLAKIRPGQTLQLVLNDDKELLRLTLRRNKVSSLRILIEDNEITATEHREDLERRIAHATGVIESSLFVDGLRAGLDDGLIMELAAIFGWDIDFALEIRGGDRFSVVYEELFLGEEKVRNGNILAAEFVNRGNEHRALRFATSGEDVAYYDPEGRNKRRAFIRTPVKFGRVSSRFTNRRWHPVLKKWRSHKGVDYAAPTGTPIKAAGAGRVVFRGWKGGYGRVIFIEHAQKYTTVYGHMSRYARSVKSGSRVKQGQVIGYVGKSGLATGPHLHYEFRVNGVHRNPLTVKLPKSSPLPKRKLAAFRRATEPLLATLNKLSQGTLLAEADPR